MSVIRTTKEFSFDMAHMLANHDGLCKNIHGHTYKLLVTVGHAGELIESGPAAGMNMDFKLLKIIVNSYVIDKLDHALMLYSNSDSPLEQKLLEFFKENPDIQKTVLVNYRPTAELMARDIFNTLDVILRKHACFVARIRLYETPTSYVDVYPN